MLIKNSEVLELNTPIGEMCAHIFRPATLGKYPAILMFSEVFQATVPIHCSATVLSGQGFIAGRFDKVGTRYKWHEFNSQHALMRDEGHRYDPTRSRLSWNLLLEPFDRRLGWGDLDMESDSTSEVRH
jgi:hypothetical protein